MVEPGATRLQLHDTLSGQKKPLQLLRAGHCGVYCCGPTVYDMSHIGHARAALVPDLLVRFLRHEGLQVTYVRNVTDIDDKIIRRAAESGEAPQALAERYLDEYRLDLHALGMLPPDAEPKVTQSIDAIVEMIAGLQGKGLAYEAEGDVYFEVGRFPEYGALSKRDVSELRAGARVDVDPKKRAAVDFALWKAAKPGEPAWESPWGPGRPGWHIECSAMACRHLGQTFDIHGGGQDLVFPHHENEIAQSRGLHGADTYARYWVHNGFVNFAGEKMSKSLGNFFTIREVTALYHPEVLRFFLLGVHYRRGVNFDVQVTCPRCGTDMPEADQAAAFCSACQTQSSADALRQQIRFPGLEEADERLSYIYETLEQARTQVRAGGFEDDGGPVPAELDGLQERFVAHMRDDLNTAAALAELSEPLSLVNRLLASGKGVPKDQRKRTLARFSAAMTELGRILGLFERDPATYRTERRDLKAQRVGLDVARVEQLVAERQAARDAKAWARADELRDELSHLGVKLRDAAGQTTWTL